MKIFRVTHRGAACFIYQTQRDNFYAESRRVLPSKSHPKSTKSPQWAGFAARVWISYVDWAEVSAKLCKAPRSQIRERKSLGFFYKVTEFTITPEVPSRKGLSDLTWAGHQDRKLLISTSTSSGKVILMNSVPRGVDGASDNLKRACNTWLWSQSYSWNQSADQCTSSARNSLIFSAGSAFSLLLSLFNFFLIIIIIYKLTPLS